MTAKELKEGLEKIVPVRYKFFKSGVQPPYAVYYINQETHRGADEENLITEPEIIIELYTKDKDFALEKQIDKLLSCVEFTKDEGWIESEQMLQIVYRFTQILKEDINGKW